MSVEGLWKFQSGSLDAPHELVWGGVVTLESNHVLGGDSVMAYVGTYDIDRSHFTATVRSFVWNKDLENINNVFGMEGPDIDFIAVVDAVWDGERVINGNLTTKDRGPLLGFRMEKIAEVP